MGVGPGTHHFQGITAKEWLWIDDFDPIYQTDSYGGIDDDVTTIEKFTDDIDLTSDMLACIDFHITPSNATDSLLLSLYNSIGTWTGKEISWKRVLTLSNPGSEFVYHYNITPKAGPGHYRWGIVSDGSSTLFHIKVIHATGRSWDVRRPTQTE